MSDFNKDDIPNLARFSHQSRKKLFWKRVLLITAAAVVVFIVWKAVPLSLVWTKSSAYYAVFLTNGQVYFGNIKDNNFQELTLNRVYYLRASNSLAQEETDKSQDLEVALVKLGQELHGPKDEMVINKSQILYWEELRNDSKVVEAIRLNKF